MVSMNRACSAARRAHRTPDLVCAWSVRGGNSLGDAIQSNRILIDGTGARRNTEFNVISRTNNDLCVLHSIRRSYSAALARERTQFSKRGGKEGAGAEAPAS